MNNLIINKFYKFFKTYAYVPLFIIYFVLFSVLDQSSEIGPYFKLNISFMCTMFTFFLCIIFSQVFVSWENFSFWLNFFFVLFIYFGFFVYFIYFFLLFIYAVWVSICSIEIEFLSSPDFLMERRGIKGWVYGDVVYKYKWYYGINQGKSLLFHNKDFFLNKSIIHKNIYLEGITKVNHHRIYEELNVLDKQSMKLLFPLENSELQNYIVKGGDLILEKDNDVLVIELKNRVTEFDTENKLKNYTNKLVKDYDKNMIIAVECDTSKIAYELMNYTKNLNGKEFCFDKADLIKPEVVAELENLLMKSKFEQLVIRDASEYHNVSANADLSFAGSTEAKLSQYTPQDIEEFKKHVKLDVVECFENPKHKINADLKKNLSIYNEFLYGKLEK